MTVMLLFNIMTVIADDKKDEDQSLETYIKGIKYENYRDDNNNIKVKVTGFDLNNLPESIEIVSSVTFEYEKWDEEKKQYVKTKVGPLTVDAIECTFYGCTKIKSASIANSITKIPNGLFDGCSNLVKANISDKITALPSRTFAGTAINSIGIPGNITAIGSEAFKDCKNLVSAPIPNNVKVIHDEAFSGCLQLTQLELGDVEKIGSKAFENCKSLYNVNIPNTTTDLGNYAFMGCENLTEVYIGEGIRTIGQLIFKGCNNIKNIYVIAIKPPSLHSFFDEDTNNYPFVKVVNYDTYKNDGKWSDYAKMRQSDHSDLSILQPLYQNNRIVVDLDKENKTASVLRIRSNRGYNPAQQKNRYASQDNEPIEIPETITFEREIYTVNTIKSYAFSYDEEATSVSLPAYISVIEEDAFYRCSNLSELFCLAQQVPEADADAFNGTNISEATLYVPISSVEFYQEKIPWRGFGKIVGIDTSNIKDINSDNNKSNVWFNLQGFPINEKPLLQGVYIFKGKKQMVK